MIEPLIELEEVGLHYRRRKSFFRSEHYQVFQGISLSVNKGETLGIIGRNGAGKSTLLRLLAGIYKPNSGRVVNHGAAVSLLSLQVGFEPELSGWDNIFLSGMLLGFSRKEILSRQNLIAEFSELGEFLAQPIKTYSNGMRARLGFAVSMALEPDVLLVDEVLGVGDHLFRKKTERAIVDKVSGANTVVLVSHAEGQIKRLCERVIWIEEGAIMATGTPDEVFRLYNQIEQKATTSGSRDGVAPMDSKANVLSVEG